MNYAIHMGRKFPTKDKIFMKWYCKMDSRSIYFYELKKIAENIIDER
jgi:hypothetical protein